MEAANVVLEDSANGEPCRVVDARCRWHGSNAGKEDRDIDVSPEGQWVPPSQEVERDGEEGANEEEPK